MNLKRVYSYSVATVAGEIVSGQLVALDENDAYDQADAIGQVISININLMASINATFFTEKIKKKDILFFLMSLKDMMSMGIDMETILSSLYDATPKKNKKLRGVIASLQQMVNSGYSLSAAMTKIDAFPSFITLNMQMGEKSGTVEDAIAEITLFIQNEIALANAVKKEIIQPVITVITAFGIAMAALYYGIPKLKSIAPTDHLTGIAGATVKLSDYLVDHPLVAPIALIAFFFGFYFLSRTLSLTYNLPIIGEFLRNKQYMSMFSSLASFQKSGMTVLDSLSIITSSNKKLGSDLGFSDAVNDISMGVSISSAIGKRIPHHSIVKASLEIAERTGKIDIYFASLAKYFREKTLLSMQTAISFISPLTIFFVGGIVLLIVMTAYQIIYGAVTSTKGGM